MAYSVSVKVLDTIQTQIPMLQLTQVHSSMWKIPAGSIVCLDGGNTVFFHFDGYCYQNNLAQKVQDEDFDEFLSLLPD